MLDNAYKAAMEEVRLDEGVKQRITENCISKNAAGKRKLFPFFGISLNRKICAALVVAALLICIIPFVKNRYAPSSPLIITVYAKDASGNKVATELELGKRVLLYEEKNIINNSGDKCYAFDLTLMDNTYVAVMVVDENLNVMPTNEETLGKYGEKGRWAYLPGDDISTIFTHEDGSVYQGYLDGTIKPDRRSKSLAWLPNNENNCYVCIKCFDTDFEPVGTYYLKMCEADGGYCAEIIKWVES